MHTTSGSGTTEFYRAARGGSAKILDLLYNTGSDINVEASDCWTPIYEAIEMGQDEVLDQLLSWGVNLQVRNDSGNTTLLTAILFDCVKMIEKIARKLQHIARTEGPSPFTEEAEPHNLAWDLELTSMMS